MHLISYVFKELGRRKILNLHSHWQPLIDVALADGTLQIACRRLKSNSASAEGGSTSPGVERLNYISVSATGKKGYPTPRNRRTIARASFSRTAAVKNGRQSLIARKKLGKAGEVEGGAGAGRRVWPGNNGGERFSGMKCRRIIIPYLLASARPVK